MAEKRNFKGNNYDKSLCRTRIYLVWQSMKTRCSNQNVLAYKNYGGRGIKYDSKWENFEGFYEDMKEGYSDKLTLDRIDNNKNYCKNNCKWSTMMEQANNRRSNTLIEYNGVSKTVEQWSRYLNIKSSTLRQRYFCYKWTVEKCLTFNKI